MSFNYKSLLPTPAQIKAEFPLTPECVELKAARDKEVADVITGKSKKFLVIIGPCSADREDAVCEYMSRLAKVNEQVKDKLVIVPRVYTNKPRTTGGGYKGMLHQPDPEKKPNMYEGLVAIRKLHMRVIEDYGFTTADEMLYPENYSYLSDVLSYSRLLALGLATGVIASVVNQMGSMGGKSIGGVILFIVVFVIGHTFNMAINLLGAYVHTCRLQYVEFFGKFYEGGGQPFQPFKLKTKYVDIKEEK